MDISEVAKKFDLTPDTLRYYEKVGLIPKIKRSTSGKRDYSEQDCGWIDFIKCMRNAGVQVEALAEYVKLFKKGEFTAQARKEILLRERDRISTQIAQMQSTLERLNKKIELYEKAVMPTEKELALAYSQKKDC